MRILKCYLAYNSHEYFINAEKAVCAAAADSHDAATAICAGNRNACAPMPFSDAP